MRSARDIRGCNWGGFGWHCWGFWLDAPAPYHNNGCMFSFADGHVAYRHRNDTSRIDIGNDRLTTTFGITATNVDWIWAECTSDMQCVVDNGTPYQMP